MFPPACWGEKRIMHMPLKHDIQYEISQVRPLEKNDNITITNAC
jgi:hypothetical protein